MTLRTRFWLKVIAVLLAVGIANVDITIVVVAYDTIKGALSATLDEISWVSTAYVLGGITIMPLNGWLHARIGRRRLLLGSIAVFTAGSVACMASHDVLALSLARGVQGAGGGLLQPSALAVLMTSFAPEKRARAQTLYGYGFMLGPLVGVLLAGAILTVSTWQALFAINVPIGILALFLVAVSVDDDVRAQAAPLQPVSLLAMAVGLFALQDVLQRGEAVGWFDSTEIVFAGATAVIGLTAFTVLQLTTARPMVDLTLLRLRTFWTVNANVFPFAVASMGVAFLVPAFCQDTLRYDPWITSLSLTPTVPAIVLGMALGQPMIRRTSPHITMIAGFLLMALGCVWLADLRYESTFAAVAGARALLGFGNGLVFVPLGLVNVVDVPATRMPAAAGLMALDRQIASAFAVAIVTSVFEHAEIVDRSHIVERMNGNTIAVIASLHEPRGRSKAAFSAMLRDSAEEAAQLQAYQAAFRLGAFGCLGAALFAFASYRRPEGAAKPSAGGNVQTKSAG